MKTYGQAGDLDKVLAAWDEMEEPSSPASLHQLLKFQSLKVERKKEKR